MWLTSSEPSVVPVILIVMHNIVPYTMIITISGAQFIISKLVSVFITILFSEISTNKSLIK